jgi:dynein heavy chain
VSHRYLESIFSAPDIQKQLPDDAALFAQIDKSWREMMRKTSENPIINQKWNIMPMMRDTLVSHNVNLDKLQKRLEDYLETKRSLFPRFYFLSNDELLEILAQTKNVQAVQRHLRKCFDNIVKLDFGNDPKVTDMIYAMISAEDEAVRNFGGEFVFVAICLLIEWSASRVIEWDASLCVRVLCIHPLCSFLFCPFCLFH